MGFCWAVVMHIVILVLMKALRRQYVGARRLIIFITIVLIISFETTYCVSVTCLQFSMHYLVYFHFTESQGGYVACLLVYPRDHCHT